MERIWAVFVLSASAALFVGCQSVTQADTAIEHYVAGRMAMDQGEAGYEAAMAELAKAIQADPSLSVAHLAIGDIHRRQGDYEQAVAAYERACQANPYAFVPHYNMGVTYQLLARAASTAKAAAEYVRKAVQVYLRAVILRPDDFDANLNLSACYFGMGKYDLAEQYCRKAIRIDPRNPFAHSNLGTIFDAQNRPYDAIRAYKDSLELDVNQPKLIVNLGSTYLRLGRIKDALHAFELATGQDPDFSDAWERLGRCHFLQKQWDEALRAYRQAVRAAPRSATAYRGLGVVYMTRFISSAGDTSLRDKGLAAWNRSLELDSSQADLHGLVRKYTPGIAGPEL